MKQLTVIYQDPCGSSPWCAHTRRIASKEHIRLARIDFMTPLAHQMLAEAKEKAGWHGVPVITDGEKYSANIEDFITKKKQKGSK